VTAVGGTSSMASTSITEGCLCLRVRPCGGNDCSEAEDSELEASDSDSSSDKEDLLEKS